MKALFLTEGGKDIGFGHITRCISLSQAFEGKDIMSELIVNGDDSILDLLRDKNYRIFNWLRGKNRLFEIVGNADIVIIDSYLAEKSLYDRISEIDRGRIVIIDDYNRLEYAKGIVVNPSIYGDRLNYPQKEGVIYLLGKDYIILRKEFWSISKNKVNKEVKNILVTFGGMGHSDVTHKIINYLKGKFNFNFYVVGSKKKNLDAKGMLNLMLKADICVSAGGQTTYELARVGTPTIGICFAENQRLNLEAWRDEGFIEYIGWYNDGHLLEKIGGAIDKFLPYEGRMKRSEIGRDYVDGKGVARVVNTLLKRNGLNSRRNFIKKSQ